MLSLWRCLPLVSDRMQLVAIAGLVICYVANVLTMKIDGILFASVVGAIMLIIGIKYGRNTVLADHTTTSLESFSKLP